MELLAPLMFFLSLSYTTLVLLLCLDDSDDFRFVTVCCKQRTYELLCAVSFASLGFPPMLPT